SAWATNFDGTDDATLVLHAGDWDEQQLAQRVGSALIEAGIRDDDPASPDMLAVPASLAGTIAPALVERCTAVFSRTAPPAPFDSLRRVDEHEVSQLRDLLPARRLDRTPDALSRVSPELREFVSECPNERLTILEFLLQVADELEPGLRVLDVGAGEQPYRELFAHVEYRTTDWANSVHPGARRVDYVAPADDLPIPDESFDAVLSTQVLEHVAEPSDVLRELHRVLRPGGRVYVTLPLAWELHEEPFDFYRYTRYGISHLLRAAGFIEIDARPRNDCFTTIAQLMRNAFWAMGRAPDGLDHERDQAGHTMLQLAEVVQGFSRLDTRWSLPLGYAVRARRPD
ncbi:MAG TPA: methyltransferase domain-containing protein, partial [Solirubrobacteraceae bacterium]|nr:methyltransferase domain-containing protein [Solirubrobacteraceae bacterium]